MRPHRSDSRPATPNGMVHHRMESATPVTSQNGHPTAQAAGSRRASRISGVGHPDPYNGRDHSLPRQSAARMYHDCQGDFTPGRHDEDTNVFSRASSYVPGEEIGSSNFFGGQSYSQGALQHRSTTNGHGFQNENYGYQGYQNSPVGTPVGGNMNGIPNGVNHIANGGRVEHYPNGSGYRRSFSGAGAAYPDQSPEPVDESPNIYPQFDDGDIRIISPSGKMWKLHSIILMKASPVFARLLDANPGSTVTRRMRDEGNFVKWTIFMTADHKARGIDPEGLKYMRFDKIVSRNPPNSRCLLTAIRILRTRVSTSCPTPTA